VARGDGAWRSFDDTDGLSDNIRKFLDELRRQLPRAGDSREGCAADYAAD
jgi:hypothetical protein